MKTWKDRNTARQPNLWILRLNTSSLVYYCFSVATLNSLQRGLHFLFGIDVDSDRRIGVMPRKMMVMISFCCFPLSFFAHCVVVQMRRGAAIVYSITSSDEEEKASTSRYRYYLQALLSFSTQQLGTQTVVRWLRFLVIYWRWYLYIYTGLFDFLYTIQFHAWSFAVAQSFFMCPEM